MSYWQNIKVVLGICLRGRGRLVFLTLVMVLAFNLLELSVPKLLQLLVACLEGSPLKLYGFNIEELLTPDRRIPFFVITMLVVALFKWVVAYLRGVLQARLGQGALYDLRNRIYEQVQALSFAYHDQNHSGRFVANIIDDVGQVSSFFEHPFFMSFQVAAGFLCIYGYMLLVCWQAALASILLLLLVSLSIPVFRRYGYPIFRRTRSCLESMVSSFSENMEGHLLVRAFGMQDEEKKKYDNAVKDYHDNQLYARAMWSMLNQALLWGVVLGVPLVLAVGIWRLRSERTFGADEVFLVFFLQNMLLMRVRILSRIIDRWTHFSVAAERLGGLFDNSDYLPDVANPDTLNDELEDAFSSCALEIPKGDVEIKDVYFTYCGTTGALNGVSLKISPGETIGLVGGSGSGKSTLALLLCRFYDPDSGTITIGDVDVRGIPVSRLRHQFSLVFQDTFLFSATIRENISYGLPGASEEKIINAAKLAHAHEFIESFLDGYDTKVGERGVTLSGGQRQRLSIARAILRHPRFLILDDATSSLDTNTEQSIQESIDALPHDITRIIIAHRYSSIARADRVYVLSDGKIIEEGTPEELNHPGSEMTRLLIG